MLLLHHWLLYEQPQLYRVVYSMHNSERFPLHIADQFATQNVLVATQKSPFAAQYENIQCAQNKLRLNILLCKIAGRTCSLHDNVPKDPRAPSAHFIHNRQCRR